MDAYDAYLFDWDGTAARTIGVWLKLIRQTLEQYDLPDKSDQELIRLVFGRAEKGLTELGVPKDELPVVFAQWDDQASEEFRRSELYPDFSKLLSALKNRGKKLAVITATVRPTLQHALKTHNLDTMFDVIVAGGETRDKPDPEGILLVLTKIGVPKNRAVMIGDSEKDLLAAKNAGIDSILFYPFEHESLHDLALLKTFQPVRIIRAWRELLAP